jgi:acetyl esterase
MIGTKIKLLFILIIITTRLFAQNYNVEKTLLVYKEINDISLVMEIYRPQMPVEMKLPALVLFFGGGWVSGEPSEFSLQAEYFASRGMVVICPDYRTKNKHNTTPFESVKDARSALRYLKNHGTELGIDTGKIVAGGGSAGGHLALSTAVIQNINELTDDLSVSPVPYALVLFSPVVDTGKKGYGQEKLEGREFEISPVHNIKRGMPPTLIIHGKMDEIVPLENIVHFKHIMQQEDNKITLKRFRKQKHEFYKYSINPKYFRKTLLLTENFLEEYELLKGVSWVKQYSKSLN